MGTAVGALRIFELTRYGVIVLAIEGELDLQTVPELCSRLSRHRGGRIVLDASRLGFCDSCGLRAIMGEARENRILGGHLVVVAPPSGTARRLFELTGLAEVIDVAEDRPSAIAVA
jgi:anti-sigma B factor antagonist